MQKFRVQNDLVFLWKLSFNSFAAFIILNSEFNNSEFFLVNLIIDFN